MLARKFVRVPKRAFSTVITKNNDITPTNTNQHTTVQLDPVSEPYGIASGAPEQFVHRTVRIFHPSPSATQQLPRTSFWHLEFESTSRWLNPLMGWTSTGDTAHQVRLQFNSREEAIAYAERYGFRWTELKEQVAKTPKKSYADNFKWKGFPKQEQARSPPSAKQAA
jgi:NADH dehydrogenase (ubiquinone) Fe-S protein 4